jgi:hypothetical protein
LIALLFPYGARMDYLDAPPGEGAIAAALGGDLVL